MPYVSEKKLGPPTLEVFVPCDPRIDEMSRKRAFNIEMMTSNLLAKNLRMPDGNPRIFSTVLFL